MDKCFECIYQFFCGSYTEEQKAIACAQAAEYQKTKEQK